MERVIEHLQRNQEQAIRELCEYVRFPSVSAQAEHRGDLVACAEWLSRRCQQAGLESRVCPTAGHPIVLAKTPRPTTGRRPHYVIYGHYDVQPPEPFELWKTPPFEARIQDGALLGRGASDNKGQNLAHLLAVEAYLKTGTPLPCDITFVLEGEEEVGSTSLATFLKENLTELKCDAVVISDTGMPSPKHPALTYALRGIVGLEVILHGPGRDLHSGIFGGTVDNPALALCQLLARLRRPDGKVAIPGFYNDVQPLSGFERDQFKRLPFNEREYTRFLGVRKLFGERGFSPLEQRSARPTFELNGLTSGYQGEGSKTIIPAWARAKITARLVPNQSPAKIERLIRGQLKKLCPPTVRLELKFGHCAEPYLVSPTSAKAQAALRALKVAFNAEPVLLREGGSIPIVNEFKKTLGAESLMVGLALPDDNAHSPNEKFDLGCFAKGQLMSAHLWQELSRL
jgi:acetylornithine deacetylase/succinyl-diaminopimelate desuccinylase-like protein